MSCTCNHCGEQYKVDLNIQDDLWVKINPNGTMMCGNCIIKSLENIGYGAFELNQTQPHYLYHCTDYIEAISISGVLWGSSVGDYSEDSARRTFLSLDPIKQYGSTTIMVCCDNYNVVDMGGGEYVINEPIAFHRDCELL